LPHRRRGDRGLLRLAQAERAAPRARLAHDDELALVHVEERDQPDLARQLLQREAQHELGPLQRVAEEVQVAEGLEELGEQVVPGQALFRLGRRGGLVVRRGALRRRGGLHDPTFARSRAARPSLSRPTGAAFAATGADLAFVATEPARASLAARARP
jgi:hypothetical protein